SRSGHLRRGTRWMLAGVTIGIGFERQQVAARTPDFELVERVGRNSWHEQFAYAAFMPKPHRQAPTDPVPAIPHNAHPVPTRRSAAPRAHSVPRPRARSARAPPPPADARRVADRS